MVKTGMKQSRILLTGFEPPKNGVSPAKELLEQVDSHEVFFFSNDFNLIKEEADTITNSHYDYIIMFGGKPVIKRVLIEIEAKEGKNKLFTNTPLNLILDELNASNISYAISQNAGNSYCNYAYYQTLKSVFDNKLDTKVIFIHIPSLNNFVDMKKVINKLNNL